MASLSRLGYPLWKSDRSEKRQAGRVVVSDRISMVGSDCGRHASRSGIPGVRPEYAAVRTRAIRIMKKRMVYIIIATIVLLPVAILAVSSGLAKRPTNLGVSGGRLFECPASPNCVSTQAADARHQIEPIRCDGSSADAFERLRVVIGAEPRMRIVTESEDYIHAEVASALFRFVDDVEFLIDRNSRLIHARSASRVGHSDFGVNRARMTRIRDAFQTRRSD